MWKLWFAGSLWCCAPVAAADADLPLVDLDRLPPLPARPAHLPRPAQWDDDGLRRVQPAPDGRGVFTIRGLDTAESRSVVGEAYQLWWRPVDGPPRLLQQRRLREDPDGGPYLVPDMAVSRDGLWVAWSSQDGKLSRIEVQRRDQAKAQVVAQAPMATMVDAPCFTPDGRSVIYSRWRGEQDGSSRDEADQVKHSLRIVGRDGRGDRLFLAEAEPFGAWSPDGRFFAYRLRRSLRVYEPATGAGRALVQHRILENEPGSLQWSPDGRWVSFVGESRAWADASGLLGWSLYIVPAAGGEPHELAPAFPPYAWLPDSCGLLCDGPHEFAPELPLPLDPLQVVDLEGRTKRLLGLPEQVFLDLRWAPDSRSLVAVARARPQPGDTPGAGRRLACTVGLDGAVAPLAPSGVWEACPTAAGLLTLCGRPERWVGSGPAELALAGAVLLRESHLRAASATPDGRRIAVVQGLPGAARVLLGPPFGPVANMPADVEYATLSPDGALLAFVTAGRRVGVVRADGGGLRLAPDLADRLGPPVWLPDGTAFLPAPGATVAFTPAGARTPPPRDTCLRLPRTERDYLDRPDVAVPARLSPDGRWLAGAYRGAIWVVATQHGSQPQCLADTGARRLTALLWPPRPAAQGSRP